MAAIVLPTTLLVGALLPPFTPQQPPNRPSVLPRRLTPPLPQLAASAALLSSPLQAVAEEVSSVTAPDWLVSWSQSEEARQLFVYFAQTAISWGVPGAFVILLAIVSLQASGVRWTTAAPVQRTTLHLMLEVQNTGRRRRT
jgi:hypothetical protein